jgi:hypothetical protein
MNMSSSLNSAEQNEESSNCNKTSSYFPKTGWNAIIVGVIIGFAYEILLNFLGVGLGLTTFSGTTKMLTIGVGAIIWIAISGIVSMGIGGWFTGKLSNTGCRFQLITNGLIAWSIATIITIVISTTASSVFVGGVINIIKSSEYELLSQPSNLENNSYSQSESNLTNNNYPQQDVTSDEQVGNYANNIGKAFLTIFIAFLFSGLATVLGTICGGHKCKKE